MDRIIIDFEHLNDLYIDQNLTRKDIARKFNCSMQTITRNIDEYGIDRPKKEETPIISGIYFIQSDIYVKIGRSTDINFRKSVLQSGNPHSLILLGYIEINNEDERREKEQELHERFKEYNHKNEWFLMTDKIRDYIRSI